MPTARSAFAMLPEMASQRPAAQADRTMPPNRLLIRRCDPANEVAPLALAAQGWDEAERPALWKTVRRAALEAPQSVILLAAEHESGLVAAQVAQIFPGRVALTWPIQWVDSNGPTANPDGTIFVIRSFENELTDCLFDAGCVFVQALTPPSDQYSSQALSLQGFMPMAQLVYLVDELGSQVEMKTGGELTWVDMEPHDESRLARVIERTYVGTQDCPWLDRWRTTADVLAGYRAVGRYDPAFWKIARHGADDVGCVLVNVHEDVHHAELVYLGLVPEARGRGWAVELVDRARQLAREAGCQRMVLAVDDANEPAKRLYARCGMEEFGRRQLWIHPVLRRGDGT